MESSTNCTNQSTALLQWNVVEIAAAIFSLLSLYMVIASIVFEVKTKQTKREERAKSRNEYRLALILCFAIPTSFAFVFLSFVNILLPLLVNENMIEISLDCQAQTLLETWSQNLALIFAFLILWLRIKLFYWHEVLKTLQTKKERILTYVVLFVIVFACTQLTIAVSFTQSVSSCGRCIGSPDTPIQLSSYIAFSFTFSIVSSLFCLTILAVMLIRPLKSNLLHLSNRTRECIRKLSRRILMSTVASTVTFLAAASFIFVTTIGFEIGNIFISNLIYNAMLFGNNLMILLSFANWRVRFFPFCSLVADESEA